MTLITRENALLLTLSVAEGSLLIDRIAVGMLAPWLSADLALTNTELGWLSAAFTLAFALSGYLFSAVSDRSGRRDEFLVGLLLLFSLISSLTGLVGSLAALLALRVLLGIAEGPFLPIAQARMAVASSPARRAFNLAFLQQVGGFVLAQGLGTLVLTWLAGRYGWRTAFLLTGIPGLALALGLWVLLRRLRADGAPIEPSAPLHMGSPMAAPGFGELTRHRNVLLACCIAACMGSWILLQMTFLPQYLVKSKGLSAAAMGAVMSMVGVSGCIASLALPVASNRLGRRPVLIAGCFAGVLLPLAMLWLPAQPWALMLAMLLGGVSFGCSPLYVSIVPNDVVPPQLAARAVALVSACSAVVGGTLMPPLGGRLADAFGIAWPIGMAAIAAVLAGLFSILVCESAPQVLARAGAARQAGDRDRYA